MQFHPHVLTLACLRGDLLRRRRRAGSSAGGLFRRRRRRPLSARTTLGAAAGGSAARGPLALRAHAGLSLLLGCVAAAAFAYFVLQIAQPRVAVVAAVRCIVRVAVLLAAGRHGRVFIRVQHSGAAAAALELVQIQKLVLLGRQVQPLLLLIIVNDCAGFRILSFGGLGSIFGRDGWGVMMHTCAA